MKITLDTNVLISALIKKGKPRNLLFEIIRRRDELILSTDILAEFVEISSDPKIRRYVDREDVTKFLKEIASVTRIVRMKSKFRVIPEDPDDDLILRAAYDGRAAYLVSGDKHVLKLRLFRKIRIVTADEILRLLNSS